MDLLLIPHDSRKIITYYCYCIISIVIIILIIIIIILRITEGDPLEIMNATSPKA